MAPSATPGRTDHANRLPQNDRSTDGRQVAPFSFDELLTSFLDALASDVAQGGTHYAYREDEVRLPKGGAPITIMLALGIRP